MKLRNVYKQSGWSYLCKMHRIRSNSESQSGKFNSGPSSWSSWMKQRESQLKMKITKWRRKQNLNLRRSRIIVYRLTQKQGLSCTMKMLYPNSNKFLNNKMLRLNNKLSDLWKWQSIVKKLSFLHLGQVNSHLKNSWNSMKSKLLRALTQNPKTTWLCNTGKEKHMIFCHLKLCNSSGQRIGNNVTKQ